MKKIYLLTNSKGLIPQRTYERESLNLSVLESTFQEKDFDVEVLTFDEFANNDRDKSIEGNYFLYASSQYAIYKEYIQDILLNIIASGGILVPNFHAFNAHENKNAQELEKKRLGISSPSSYLIGTYEDGVRHLERLNFPLIGKKSKGFGSKTVQKICSTKEGKKFLKKNLSEGINLNSDNLKWLIKKWKYRKLYPKYHGKVILQEMIEGLDHDWKILIFYDKCFVLKRYTRENDFRASGSGNFIYDAVPPHRILNFAYEVIDKLNVPFASLDIVEKDGKCFLIEYQTVHFGLITALNGTKYFELNKLTNNWDQKPKSREVDYFFADAVVKFIEEKG